MTTAKPASVRKAPPRKFPLNKDNIKPLTEAELNKVSGGAGADGDPGADATTTGETPPSRPG